MSIDSRLLAILRCPLTKQSLAIISNEKMAEINALIAAGTLQYADGTEIETVIEQGLITANGTRIYRIDAGIPIMLQSKCIPLPKSAAKRN